MQNGYMERCAAAILCPQDTCAAIDRKVAPVTESAGDTCKLLSTSTSCMMCSAYDRVGGQTLAIESAGETCKPVSLIAQAHHQCHLWSDNSPTFCMTAEA